jgi:rhamnosyltransferase
MATPLVSVLLLTHNGAGPLPGVLAAIKSQDAAFPFELVAVDSGSRDGTTDLLRSRVDRLVEIREADFNHGTTRNLGIEACLAPFVVLLVQDAEPESPAWLSRLVAPLLVPGSVRVEDPTPGSVAGTYARQVARPDGSAVARGYLASYAAAATEPRVQSLADRRALDALSPAERLSACTFDNVCSCIRRSVWRAHPFKATLIAEDLEWAKEVMLEGYQLTYVPEAIVLHSHDRSAGYELRRTYLIHQRLRRLFDLATVPSTLHLARSIVASVVSHTRWTLGAPIGATSKLVQLPRALALAVVMPLGQYLGAKSADDRRELLRARGV